MTTIPTSPVEVTAEWLTAALAGLLGGAEVRSFSWKPVGEGLVGQNARLFLHGDRATGAPASVLAKFPAASEASRRTARRFRSYEKEFRFYTEVAPTVGIATPACHHAEMDPETHDFVLLLEDLAPARVGNQLAGCGVADRHFAAAVDLDAASLLPRA